MITGFDFARETGVSTINDDGELVYIDTWRFFDKDPSVVIARFYERFQEYIETVPWPAVAFEDLHSYGGGGLLRSEPWRLMWYGFRWATVLRCEEHGFPWTGVPIRLWRAVGELPNRPTPRQVVRAGHNCVRFAAGAETRFPINDHEAVALMVAIAAQREAREQLRHVPVIG